MYLLVGKSRALLIDTGDVTDPGRMPLAKTVMGLLAKDGSPPLLVAHTHRHLDHRAGDAQFARLPGVQVVGYDLESVKRYYGFDHWPEGVAHIDLGERTVDVIPTPGHNATHVSFYDGKTGLFFSGDFLLPGRLLVDDAAADRASARRAAAFARDLPVTAVLGGHIEENREGQTFDWGSQYHPNERALPMTKADLMALPAAVQGFNGFYTEAGPYTFMDSMRLLAAAGFVAIALLLAVTAGAVMFFRRRRGRA
jgi:glyoxylase-like metal-dependent hydrolase (beta-lactamase superfamily II)